jgi:adenine-specific DNA methylase
LSDYFFGWLKRVLFSRHQELFRSDGTPKAQEIVVDRPHKLSDSKKDVAFYERELTKAFREGRRITKPDGIGTIVFASKSTASWEAILNAVVEADWIVTGSWPIDTEMENKVAAIGQARLMSSVHLVCRPREDENGNVREDEIGDWRDVLQELPRRMHEWMPRLAAEGIVGADAIFACLGPALEVFSRYSRVEKSNGDPVLLKDYLEHVWAAISKEALSVIFEGADTEGFEPDARLTAMWLWTLAGPAKDARLDDGEEDDEDDEEADESSKKTRKMGGFSLEYDAARKIAQGLGAHLEDLKNMVEVAGETARLLPVAERTAYLFGKEQAEEPVAAKRKKKQDVQPDLFAELAQEGVSEKVWMEKTVSKVGDTTLDRIHQSMILFASSRSEALKRFLVEDGAGRDQRFWRLAQALSALYPPKCEEKRWVDGVLARKKGLGL